MKRSTIITLLLSLLAVGCTAVWRLVPRELSPEKCSPVYRHFADMQLEGVRVTYVKDKIVNDTLRLPVTLLQAETDRGWELLDSLFGYSKDIQMILDDPDLPDIVKQNFIKSISSYYSYRAHPETPERNIEPKGGRPDDVTVFFYPRFRRVCIFESSTKEERHEIFRNAIKEDNKEKLRNRHFALIDAAYDEMDTISGISSHNP